MAERTEVTAEFAQEFFHFVTLPLLKWLCAFCRPALFVVLVGVTGRHVGNRLLYAILDCVRTFFRSFFQGPSCSFVLGGVLPWNPFITGLRRDTSNRFGIRSVFCLETLSKKYRNI